MLTPHINLVKVKSPTPPTPTQTEYHPREDAQTQDFMLDLIVEIQC